MHTVRQPGDRLLLTILQGESFGEDCPAQCAGLAIFEVKIAVGPGDFTGDLITILKCDIKLEFLTIIRKNLTDNTLADNKPTVLTGVRPSGDRLCAGNRAAVRVSNLV